MKLSPTECFLIDVLECGIDDFSLLDDIYSPLADEVMYTDWVKECIRYGYTLNDLIYHLYSGVQTKIVKNLKQILKGDDKYVRRIIEKNIKNIEMVPYANCQDSRFDSDIDQVINWDETIEQNTQHLIGYWKNQEEDGNE